MSQNIVPITRSKVADETFEQFRSMIISRQWKPGEKIPSEEELTRLLKVSRISVRAAIQRMSALGLLEARVGEGTFVREIKGSINFQPMIPMLALSRPSQQEVLEFRFWLEKECIRLACTKATPDEIRHLSDLYGQMKAHVGDENLERFIGLDFEFHLAIAKMARNSILEFIYTALKDTLYFHYETVIRNKDRIQGLDYHGSIVESIREKNVQKAERCCDELFSVVLGYLGT